MLANRLNVLLAERQLSIKQVVDDTGISRSSISNIVNNPNANISTETIDTLCNYLEIEPNDFFVYSPYSIKFGEDKERKSILVSVTHKRKGRLFSLEIYIKDDDSDDEYEATLEKFDLYISVAEETMYDNELISIYDSLAVIFKTQLTNDILRKIENSFSAKELNIWSMSSDVGYRNEMNLLDYLKALNKLEYSASIKLPWIDLEKKLTLSKKNELIFK